MDVYGKAHIALNQCKNRTLLGTTAETSVPIYGKDVYANPQYGKDVYALPNTIEPPMHTIKDVLSREGACLWISVWFYQDFIGI